MSRSSEQDNFQAWLACMNVYLDELAAAVPFKLGYSLASLNLLETWLLDRYPDADAAVADKPGMVNNAGCYVGEVIRKRAGQGKWRLDDREDSIFRGFPLLVGFRGSDYASPMSLVMASTDRRRGDYLFSVVNHHLTGN